MANSLSRVGWGLFWFLCFLAGILAFRFVPTGFTNGFLPNLDQGLRVALYEGVFVGIREDFEHIYYHLEERLTPLLFHILVGAVPIFCIPFQLWKGFRQKHLMLHRWMGRASLVGIILSAWGAINIALAMEIPLWGRAGFVIGASVWVSSAIWATYLVLNRHLKGHQDWMVLTAAMTFGAVMIRCEFPIWRQFFSFEIAYAYAAWSSWVLNVAAVLIWRYLKRGTLGLTHRPVVRIRTRTSAKS